MTDMISNHESVYIVPSGNHRSGLSTQSRVEQSSCGTFSFSAALARIDISAEVVLFRVRIYGQSLKQRFKPYLAHLITR